MAKNPAEEAVIRFSCTNAARQRGGLESVTLLPIAGKPNERFFRGPSTQGSFNLVIDGPEGQGFFDPDADYEVTFRKIPPA